MSTREEELTRTMDEVLNRPGIREIMNIFQNRQEAGMNLEYFRSATKNNVQHKADSANSCNCAQGT